MLGGGRHTADHSIRADHCRRSERQAHAASRGARAASVLAHPRVTHVRCMRAPSSATIVVGRAPPRERRVPPRTSRLPPALTPRRIAARPIHGRLASLAASWCPKRRRPDPLRSTLRPSGHRLAVAEHVRLRRSRGLAVGCATRSRRRRSARAPARVGCAVIGIDVPHAHLHLVPLDGGRGIDFRRATPAEPADLAAMAERLRARLPCSRFASSLAVCGRLPAPGGHRRACRVRRVRAAPPVGARHDHASRSLRPNLRIRDELESSAASRPLRADLGELCGVDGSATSSDRQRRGRRSHASARRAALGGSNEQRGQRCEVRLDLALQVRLDHRDQHSPRERDALASSLWVSRLPAAVRRELVVLMTSMPRISVRLSARPGGS